MQQDKGNKVKRVASTSIAIFGKGSSPNDIIKALFRYSGAFSLQNGVASVDTNILGHCQRHIVYQLLSIPLLFYPHLLSSACEAFDEQKGDYHPPRETDQGPWTKQRAGHSSLGLQCALCIQSERGFTNDRGNCLSYQKFHQKRTGSGVHLLRYGKERSNGPP